MRISAWRMTVQGCGNLALVSEGQGGAAALTPDLVARSQRGDTRAFERLYRLHVGRVYAICLRLLGDPVQAEVLTQDVFVRAWRKLGTFEGRGEFAGWLRRLTVNVVVEDRRARGRWNRWFEPFRDPAEGAAEAGDGSGRRLRPTTAGAVPPAATDAAIDLERAVAQLPPGARMAFVLHDVEGYKHHEIAALTGLATGTIKAQLHRARRLLREALSASAEEMET